MATTTTLTAIAYQSSWADSAVTSAAYTITGPEINLSIAGMYLTQPIQTLNQSVPLVSNRDAFLRVFVIGNIPREIAPTVRVRFYQNATLIDTQIIAAPVSFVPTELEESLLTSSWNLMVPGTMITPGLSILVDVDPDDTTSESDEADNSFPLSGEALSLDVREVPPFLGRLVPVVHSAFGTTGDVAAGNKETYLDLFRKIFPLGQVDVDVRSTYTTTAVTAGGQIDWGAVLSEMYWLRFFDGSSRYYYGVLQSGYGVVGMGYVGFPVAVGWDNAEDRANTYAHELGHNFGRWHSPCGNPANIDVNYPDPTGSIGAWGWDSATGGLTDPSTPDVMGYCEPYWVSEYTYEGVLAYREAEAAARVWSSSARNQPVLALWGRLSEAGVVIEPAFVVESGIAVEPAPGPYTLEGLDDTGAVLFSRTFQGEEVSHSEERHFSFIIPVSEAQIDRLAALRVHGEGRVEERRSSAPSSASRAQALENEARELKPQNIGGDRVRVQWDKNRFPMAVIRDPKTGEILSFARGGDNTIATSLSEVDILLSDGIRSTTRRVRILGR